MRGRAKGSLGNAMAGLAAFRIALGAAELDRSAHAGALVRPGDDQVTPALEYMTRVFGVRAVALGLGYLSSSGDARRLWHRLWLLCDAADTAMGVGMVARRADRPKLGVSALATTAPAMALDVAALAARTD